MWGKKKDHRLKRQLSETNQNKQRLSQLDSGDKARIVEIGGSEQFRIRLIEMGVLVNDIVEMDKLAPLQDPIEFIVKGYHLSLRRKDADKIAIEIL